MTTEEGVPIPSVAVDTTPRGDIVMQQQLKNKGDDLQKQQMTNDNIGPTKQPTNLDIVYVQNQ